MWFSIRVYYRPQHYWRFPLVHRRSVTGQWVGRVGTGRRAVPTRRMASSVRHLNGDVVIDRATWRGTRACRNLVPLSPSPRKRLPESLWWTEGLSGRRHPQTEPRNVQRSDRASRSSERLPHTMSLGVLFWVKPFYFSFVLWTGTGVGQLS